jgi:hypothetical protein
MHGKFLRKDACMRWKFWKRGRDASEILDRIQLDMFLEAMNLEAKRKKHWRSYEV